MKSIVNGLSTSSGGTETDEGIKSAASVLARQSGPQSSHEGAREEAQKVVVLFTDGEPRSKNNNNFDTSIAINAVNEAYSFKQNGTLINTVGVFFGADPSDTDDSDMNIFLNAVSSNYPDANVTNNGDWSNLTLGTRSNENYYFTADSANGLGNVFIEISDSITSNVDADGDSILTDTLTSYFEFGTLGTAGNSYSNVEITVYSASGSGDDLTWTEDNEFETANISVSVEGQTIKVTGFDYSKYLVSYDTEDKEWQGKKLVITFPIILDGDADWDKSGYYVTNVTAGLTDSYGDYFSGGELKKSPNVYVNTYSVSYEFVAAEEGVTLPTGVTSQLRQQNSKYYLDSTIVNNELYSENYDEVVTDNGTWKFVKWNAEQTKINGSKVVFIGTWEFTPHKSYDVTKTLENVRVKAYSEKSVRVRAKFTEERTRDWDLGE